jgi:4'-phosphopantetheinyl transferase
VRAVRLEPPSQGGVNLLAAAERSRAERFVSAPAAADFLAGRIALRIFAGELAGVDPSALEADYRCSTCGAVTADHGRPRYRHRNGAPGPLLSLSRSGGWALMAGIRSGGILTGLGVDVEQSGSAGFPGFDALVLSSRERLHLAPATSAEGRDQRARLWARKEAFLKATGSGLQRDPASVDVSGDWFEGVGLADLDATRLGLPDGVVVALAASSS